MSSVYEHVLGRWLYLVYTCRWLLLFWLQCMNIPAQPFIFLFTQVVQK